MDEQELYKDKEPSEGALEFTGTIDDGEIQANIEIVPEDNTTPMITDHRESSPAIINPERLISQAIDKNLDVDKLGRLLEMRAELKKEYAREAYFQALSDFQAACPPIEKNKAVYEKDGKTVRYYYATLDSIISQVKITLREFGLSYTIKAKQTETEVTSICKVYHVAGHEDETEFSVPIDPKAYMNAPQKVASAMTFSKRYAFCNAFGIMTQDQDDDANGVAEPEEPRQQPTRPQPPQNRKIGVDFQTIQAENKAVYQSIMILIRESEIPKEAKIKIKQSADAVISSLDDLRELEKSTRIFIGGYSSGTTK